MRALLLSLVVGLSSLGLTLGTPTQSRAAVPPVAYTSSFEPVAWHGGWHGGWHRGWYGGGWHRGYYRPYWGGYHRPYWGGYYRTWGYPVYNYYGAYPYYGSYYYGAYPYGGVSTPWFSVWW
jgi:hypothetical protein